MSLAYVRGIHRWPVDSPHKGPVTRKMFLFDDAIMNALTGGVRGVFCGFKLWFILCLSHCSDVCNIMLFWTTLWQHSTAYDKENNAWVTVNNDFFCHEWRDSAMIFKSDEVTSENHCRIASQVTKNLLFTVMNVLFYFLHAILCHENTNPLRTIIERSFRHCCQGWPFLTEHCDVTTIDLWRHANAKYWYCDVIFVYFHCMRKLAQRRSSLVNNSHEYRYLANRYSRLSM